MTTVKDGIQYDRHKFFAVNSGPRNESKEQGGRAKQPLAELELDWINGIHDQVEFANTQVLTQYHLKLKIAKKWRSWDKVESAI